MRKRIKADSSLTTPELKKRSEPRSLLMHKKVERKVLWTKSASWLPLRGNSELASWRQFILAVTRRGESSCSE
jgi:hypothetical protein